MLHEVHLEEAKNAKKIQSAGFKKTSTNNSLSIKFENLGLVLSNGSRVLSEVSAEFKSGRMCAIMGPSGSGKTTLLSVIMGSVERTEGTIYINKVPSELSRFKRLIGYVPQEDVMLRQLSVREILMHSAYMRLPKKLSKKQVKDKVLDTINALDLGHVIDTPIGDEEKRGISGGQRKRVNIGMELVAEPSVLFLDEPTSGLDSSTSYEVCRILKDITKARELTVAAIIHSPSLSSFLSFDDVLLLAKGGRIIYFGPTNKVQAYLYMVGFECPPDVSLPDFIMEVIAGKVSSRIDAAFDPQDLPDCRLYFMHVLAHKLT